MQPPKDLSVYPGRLPGRGNAEVIDNVVQSGELSVEFQQDAFLERLPDLWLERVEGLVDLEEPGSARWSSKTRHDRGALPGSTR